MPSPPPDPSLVWKAIETYLEHAYDGPPPPSVGARLKALRELPKAGFYDSPHLERDRPEAPSRFYLRLGNRHYPHMKLAIERGPERAGTVGQDPAPWFFRADTHDKHVAPAVVPEEDAAYQDMLERNRAIAKRIESAWAEAGLATFQAFLREDLERRRATRP